MPPPPSSPLFPYTTLFRSRRDAPTGALRRRQRLVGLGDPPHALEHRRPRRRRAPGVRVHVEQHLLDRRDRKSTRLNSSHRCISYAVFCLKKKNNPTTDTSK